MKTYKQFRLEMVALNGRAAAAFRCQHPVGSIAYYQSGNNWIEAVMMDYGCSQNLRVKVRGRSGKEYWIYADRIEENGE